MGRLPVDTPVAPTRADNGEVQQLPGTSPASTPTRSRRLKESPGRSVFRRFLFVVLALLGGWFVWREFEPLILFRRVDGLVLSSGVLETMSVQQRPMARPRQRSHWVPEVLYRYQVNGQTFVSVQFRRTNVGRSRWGATREARGYIAGSTVSAWYSPINPADSVLKRAPNLILLGLVGFVGFFLWGASWLTLNGKRPGEMQPPSTD